ncbi:MAG: hypothetical protein NC347_06210 [Clostridium sp.]|nr:hypothetical protein [Clostridium sp.]
MGSKRRIDRKERKRYNKRGYAKDVTMKCTAGLLESGVSQLPGYVQE